MNVLDGGGVGILPRVDRIGPVRQERMGAIGKHRGVARRLRVVGEVGRAATIAAPFDRGAVDEFAAELAVGEE